MAIKFPSSLLAVSIVLVGCGSSQPEHVEQPLSARPAVVNDFTKLKTPEEKIKFIQDSKAPDSEKARAIADVQAGKI